MSPLNVSQARLSHCGLQVSGDCEVLLHGTALPGDVDDWLRRMPAIHEDVSVFLACIGASGGERAEHRYLELLGGREQRSRRTNREARAVGKGVGG